MAVESDETSDRFSMLGSMVLWISGRASAARWSLEQMPRTAIATVLALCGATLATFLLSALLRKGKVAFADMANAALAGGVAVGATCNVISPAGAFGVGLLAGTLCVVGYVVVQPRIQSPLKIVDTCGVHNLHGMPGLLGGLIAVLVVPGIAKAQLVGIALHRRLRLRHRRCRRLPGPPGGEQAAGLPGRRRIPFLRVQPLLHAARGRQGRRLAKRIRGGALARVPGDANGIERPPLPDIIPKSP